MHALILGITSPIARALAACYATAGLDLVIASRDLQEVEAIAQDLRLRHQVQVHVERFDALNFDDHEAMIERAERAAGPVKVAALVFGEMGEQEDSQQDFSRAHRVIDTNYTGAVSLCEALAKRMADRKLADSSIVAISSVAGERGRASNYIYGSAKGALSLYLQGLRNRLHSQGVHVMTVKLGFVDTRMTFGMETKIPIASPQEAAQAIFNAQQRRTDVLYYPRFWAGIMGVIRSLPEPIFKRLSL